MEILAEEKILPDKALISIQCSNCMAFIPISMEEFKSCTHFACRFCGKITSISQVLLGARWDWTLEDYQPLELGEEMPP
ncbi:MAG: hypothetical protein ACE5I5_06080 [Candidatus Heimdallarchaeota archaeon]